MHNHLSAPVRIGTAASIVVLGAALTLAGCASSGSTAAGPAAPSSTTSGTSSAASSSVGSMSASSSASPMSASSSMAPTPAVMSSVAGAAKPPAGPHNQADITFASDMVPHHEQAVLMSAMAAMRAHDTRVRTLAAAIKKSQVPEIAEMSRWLMGWGKSVPSPSMAGGTTGGSGGMKSTMSPGMAGMMSAADMTRLAKAEGAAFDRMWVTMMISHHEGAVTMSRTELAHGANPEARTLARSIISSQTAQISQMRSLLTKLPGM